MYMNSNIMQTFHDMKYDLKGHFYVLETFCDFLLLLDFVPN